MFTAPEDEGLAVADEGSVAERGWTEIAEKMRVLWNMSK
jgi:hypothetical protein